MVYDATGNRSFTMPSHVTPFSLKWPNSVESEVINEVVGRYI